MEGGDRGWKVFINGFGWRESLVAILPEVEGKYPDGVPWPLLCARFARL
jgi:hypothetical protein